MGSHHCVPDTDENAMYFYCASTPAAITFAVLYGLTFAAHVYQAFHYKKRFCWVVCMAAGWEFAGLVTRALSTFDQTSIGLATPSQLLILLAPLWINAYCYMVLGRVVWFYREDGKVFGVRAPRIALLFVLADIFSFLVQGTGGVMVSPGASPSTIRLGFNVYRIGLGVQELFVLVFVALAVRFHTMVRRQDALGLSARGDVEALRLREDRPGEWKPLLYTLYTALTLITVRIVYRLAEFSSGIYGYLPTHEWVYYVFDGFLMLFVLVLFNVFHPGRWLVGEDAEWPKKTRKQKKAEKKARKEAKLAEKTAAAGGSSPAVHAVHERADEDGFDSTDTLQRFAADGYQWPGGAQHAGADGSEESLHAPEYSRVE